MVGYSIEEQQFFKSKYICRCCSLLFRDPVQLIECGHHLCQSCIVAVNENTITCPECFEKTSRKELKLDRAFKNEMQTLSIVCALCPWSGLLKTYSDHLVQSHPNPICIHCKENFLSVHDLNQHKQYTCEKITFNCPFRQYGCGENILRIDLDKHYRSEQHQRILMNIVNQFRSMKFSINHSTITEDTRNQLQELNETVAVLSDSIILLNEDLERLKRESDYWQQILENLMKDTSVFKISVQEQSSFFDGIKTNQDVLQQDLELMKEKVNDMKNRSIDGTFLWKIINVQEKIVLAQSDTQASICSPVFYSSAYGYKMCLRLYLNGDGNALGTHISLFIVLMRGEYDAILKFPFEYKVIFCLFDQTNKNNHITDAFKPDKHSDSFQRPRTTMNIASGIPQFVSLQLIHQENSPYTRDDTMYIKVLIDFDSIP